MGGRAACVSVAKPVVVGRAPATLVAGMAAVDSQPAAVLEVSLDPVHDRNVNQLRTLNRCIFPVRYQDKVYADAMTAGNSRRLVSRTARRACAAGAARSNATATDRVRAVLTARSARPPPSAHYTDIVVGGSRAAARRRRPPACIMTLGVPAYRGRGVGSQMVRNAIKLAEQDQLPRRVPARTGASAAARSWRVETRAHARVCPMQRACQWAAMPCTLLTATCVCALLFFCASAPGCDLFARAPRRAQTSNDEAVSFYKKPASVREAVKGYYKRLDPPDAYLIARRSAHAQAETAA